MVAESLWHFFSIRQQEKNYYKYHGWVFILVVLSICLANHKETQFLFESVYVGEYKIHTYMFVCIFERDLLCDSAVRGMAGQTSSNSLKSLM